MKNIKGLLLSATFVAGLSGAPAQANTVETTQTVATTVITTPTTAGGFILPLTPTPGGGASTQNDKPCAGC